MSKWLVSEMLDEPIQTPLPKKKSHFNNLGDLDRLWPWRLWHRHWITWRTEKEKSAKAATYNHRYESLIAEGPDDDFPIKKEVRNNLFDDIERCVTIKKFKAVAEAMKSSKMLNESMI